MIKKLGLALVLTLVSAAAIAGFWNTQFPILGGASFCGSTVNASCVSTIPAGPTVMTGNETVPGDTNLTGGANPQTVQIPVRLLGGGAFTYNVPVTGDSITIAATTRRLIVNPAGTIANLTIVTPAATTLYNGQVLGLCTTQIVSTLTTTAGAGTTVNGAPTALLVPVTTGGASCVEWIYRTADTTWYRIQ